MTPQWIVQNCHKEYGYDSFITSLQRLGVNFTLVNTIPFSDELYHHTVTSPDDYDSETPLEFDTSLPTVGFGTITLSRIIQQKGLNPGVFVNDNFDCKVWMEKYKDFVLNKDYIISTADQLRYNIPEEWFNHGVLFARSCYDDKKLSGDVYTINTLMNYDDPDTEILVSPPTNPGSEYRVFVVDGKPVTASLYKMRDNVIYQNHDFQHNEIVDFAYMCIQQWVPHDNFVLDICCNENGLHVLEINNINTAGFYDIDTHKLVSAMSDYLTYGSSGLSGKGNILI